MLVILVCCASKTKILFSSTSKPSMVLLSVLPEEFLISFTNFNASGTSLSFLKDIEAIFVKLLVSASYVIDSLLQAFKIVKIVKN